MVFNASCVFQYTFSDSCGTEKKGKALILLHQYTVLHRSQHEYDNDRDSQTGEMT